MSSILGSVLIENRRVTEDKEAKHPRSLDFPRLRVGLPYVHPHFGVKVDGIGLAPYCSPFWALPHITGSASAGGH